MRVGIGYDIHRTCRGDVVTLGGVEIASPFALEGHSDADVLLHAVMDALLGAAGLPDIGQHFPPTDPQFRSISSLILLDRVRGLLSSAGWHVVNVDTVLIAQRPRIGPYVESMRARIAESLGVQPAAVGVKATTNESVGPEGREEAISAHAVACIEQAT